MLNERHQEIEVQPSSSCGISFSIDRHISRPDRYGKRNQQVALRADPRRHCHHVWSNESIEKAGSELQARPASDAPPNEQPPSLTTNLLRWHFRRRTASQSLASSCPVCAPQQSVSQWMPSRSQPLLFNSFDFASELVAQGVEIHHWAGGRLVKHEELESIKQSLSHGAAKIKECFVSQRRFRELTDIEKQPKKIGIDCQQVTDELLQALDQLKLQKEETRWRSFRQALLAMWKEKKVKALEERLERFRRQEVLIIVLTYFPYHLDPKQR